MWKGKGEPWGCVSLWKLKGEELCKGEGRRRTNQWKRVLIWLEEKGREWEFIIVRTTWIFFFEAEERCRRKVPKLKKCRVPIFRDTAHAMFVEIRREDRPGLRLARHIIRSGPFISSCQGTGKEPRGFLCALTIIVLFCSVRLFACLFAWFVRCRKCKADKKARLLTLPKKVA